MRVWAVAADDALRAVVDAQFFHATMNWYQEHVVGSALAGSAKGGVGLSHEIQGEGRVTLSPALSHAQSHAQPRPGAHLRKNLIRLPAAVSLYRRTHGKPAERSADACKTR